MPTPGRLLPVLTARSTKAFFKAYNAFWGPDWRLDESIPIRLRLLQYCLMIQLGLSGELEYILVEWEDDDDLVRDWAALKEWCRQVRATKTRALLHAIETLFPKGRIPTSDVTRWRTIGRLQDRKPNPFTVTAARYRRVPDELARVLRRYLRTNKHAIEREFRAAAPQPYQPDYSALVADALQLAKRPSETRDALGKVTGIIASRFSTFASFRRLPPEDQLVYNLGFVLDAEVNNGGFEQYLSNSSGNLAEQAKKELRKVGAVAVGNLLTRVSTLFPRALIPADPAGRNAVLRTAAARDPRGTDKLFARVDRAYHRAAPRLYRLLMGYVASHRTVIGRP